MRYDCVYRVRQRVETLVTTNPAFVRHRQAMQSPPFTMGLRYAPEPERAGAEGAVQGIGRPVTNAPLPPLAHARDARHSRSASTQSFRALGLRRYRSVWPK